MLRIIISGGVVVAASLALCVSSCKKSDTDPVVTPDESGYFIVNNKGFTGGGLSTGNISFYKKAKGELVSPDYQLSVKTTAASISDAVISGDKLYVARAESRGVEIVSTSDFQVISSIPYGKGAPANAFKHLAISPDKIFVSERDFIPNSPNHSDISYLKAISLADVTKVDSIPVIQNAAIWSIAYVNGKIFVSAGYLQQAIFVFDATTYTKLGQVNLSSICSTMLIDKSDNVLALGGNLVLINSVDLSVIKVKNTFGGANINLASGDYSTCSSGFSLDRENNILYHLANAAQPASAPFVLKSYNITTDVGTTLTTNFISATTIAFDQKEKAILIGDTSGPNASKGVLNIYSTLGSVQKSVPLPNAPNKIFETQ